MTQAERDAVRQAVARIRSLASLENAGFGYDAKTDKATKDMIRPYLTWFECVAFHLEALANAGDSYDRQNAIDDIMRYCN